MAMSLNHPGPLYADGLSVLNANPAKLPGPRFLHELVPQAANNALSCAIDFLVENDRRVVLSYSQLHTASLALASRILCILRSVLAQSASTLEPSGPLIIPILSPQCPQLYVAILAALKAGGAFCPLNTDAPPERVRFILDDVKAKIVLVNRDLASKLPTTDDTCTAIFIDDVIDNLETDSEDLVCVRELTPQDLAYVMYTSGSTGTPKGVAISHLAATQSILAHDRHIPFFSRFLQFAAPTFDVSVFEMFFPLFRSATLVGCNRAEMLTNLVGVMSKMEVDACELTPSVASSLLKQRSRAPGLSLLLTIGEMLTEPVIREFGGNERKTSMLWGMYGPTEAAIHCTVQNAFATTSDRGTIGIPFDTVSAFIIRVPTDPSVSFQFEVLPIGETGELALGGLQLASCYLNRPQQTTNSFVDTPWGRVYRTGDKAKIRPDGTIVCLGRIDDNQVKLNGQRLELGEVEQALLRTPGCHGAVAAVISNVLVAFAAVDQISDYNAQLWAQCRSWLPSFMIPTDIIIVEQLPQLPSGKIDRKRLIHGYSVRTKNATGNGIPIDDFERLLCELATAILGEKVGPLTEFSAANMDSLAAIEYSSALRDNGVFVNTVDILSAKSPRGLRPRARGIGMQTISPESESHSKIYQDSDLFQEKAKLKYMLGDQVQEIDRLEWPTPLQHSMIAETLKDGHLYINQIELEVTSDAALDVLQPSLRKLAECNEILRTGFTFVENQLCQVIWKRLDDSQVYYVGNGGNSTAQIEDAESFLLRPLRIEVRPPSPERSALTLFLTLHHAIYDGWTVDLIIEDLSRLLSNEPPISRPQFAQVMGHLHHISQVNSVDSMEFWTEHLRGVGAAPVSNFGTMTAAQQQRVVNVTQIFVHPRDLKNLILKISVGPQVLFQACLLWLWATVCGTEDITIGCVSSGRSLPVAGIDKLMGPCMTTLPLRINISKYRTIIELLQSIHSINREILRYGGVPLSQINTAAGLSSSSKLFDIIFAYQESLASRKQNSNAVRETWHRDATEANLVVEIQPKEDHFICQTTSRTDVLPQGLAEAFTRHLGSLVSHFASHVDAAVASIFECFPLDSLSHFNSNPKAIETYSSLSEMVETSALRFPSASALRFATSLRPSAVNSETFSYQELNSKANQIGRHLQQCGLGSGGVIAIIMEKSPLLYCSILGILKAGCAYLPILPTTPSERVKVILNQAEPCLCIVDALSSPLVFGRGSPKVINIETVTLSSYSDANIGRRSRPLDLAYVIYTSGTTGTPKGVAVTNRNILSNINVLSSLYPHDPSDRMLQACSQAFDVSVFEIFFAWANGMCLCAATNDTLFEDFEHAVRGFQITHLSLTVTVASLLNPGNVPSVNFLVTSGEPMTDEVLNRWAQYLYQGYGPSETTNICTVRKVSCGDSPQFLGWSFENTSTFVLYPNSTHLVPLGCKGELCFGGDQVASGYLKLPEETATKFINHPRYGRLYRSGDLGRMLPDGSLIIHGRMDTQVKLRGMRIELQEIQTVALNTGLTKVCRSILVTHDELELQQLALFYVPSGTEISNFKLLSVTTPTFKEQIRALRDALQSSLPDYMIPSFIFPISTLPLTSSGKVDERALHTAISKLSNSALESYSPVDEEVDMHRDWSTTEILIAKAITDCLPQDRKKVGRWTTFSALGLDSISAMPIARKLQSSLQKRIPLSLLLQHPSINRLAPVIDGLETSGKPSPSHDPLLPDDLIEIIQERLSTKRNSVTKMLPCTPLQEAMVMSSLNPSSATGNGMAYYNQMLFHLHIPYEGMMGLWNEIVQRHEILRTFFVTTENIKYPVVQLVLDSYAPEWRILDDKNVSLREHASQHVTSSSITAETNVPPIALAIIRTDDSGDYLSFVCHHAMYDGISMRLMLSEIEALYYGKHLPNPLSIEPFLREIKLSDAHQNGFWKRLFLNFQPISLKCTRLTKDTMPRTLSASAVQTSLQFIESQLRDAGVSMLAFVHTIWAITLSILSQKNDISFGSVTSGRSIALDEVDNIVAPCFNTLPIRMDLSASTFLIDVMKKFQNLNAKMILYQFTNLRHIQKEVGAQTRLFDSLVILQPSTEPLDDKIWSLEYEDGFMDIPIVCEVIPDKLQDTLTIQLHRDKSKFSYQALQLISNIFGHVIDTWIRYPSSHIFMRDALPEDYRKEIPKLFHCPEHSHAPDNNSPSLAPNHEQDWSELELRVRQTLAKLAQVPEHLVKRLAPIYQYGLDSIAAIQLANLLRQQSLPISAIDVIEKPTCAGIAAAIKSSVKTDIDDIRDFSTFQKEIEMEMLDYGIDPETIEAALPCTATQQGLLSQFLDSKGRYYFNYSSWILDAAIDPETFARAWPQLTNCHQILRTGFIPVNHSDSTFAMIVYAVDYFNSPVKTYESGTFQREQWLSDAISNSLNTMALPPWQLALEMPGTPGSEEAPMIHLAMHHALYDAFTLRSLLQDLSGLISHGIKPIATDISQALSHHLSLTESSQLAGAAFWKEKADIFTSHKFPVMTPLHESCPDTLTTSSTCKTSSLDFRKAASQASITLQAALQASWTRLLSAYTGESRITFGVVLDGRITDLSRKTTLPMITTVPVIADNLASNADLIKEMMQYNSELHRFQFMPMAQIQRCLGTADAVFDTILIYQAVDRSPKPLPFHAADEIASVEYPISLEVEESPSNTIRLTLSYRASVLPREQAMLLLNQFESILTDLLFPTQSEASLAINRPNLFSILPPISKTLPIHTYLLHELLENSAQLVPSAVALEFVDDIGCLNNPQRWTYQELDAVGNRIAQFIINRGVRPGSIIATCFNKCPIAYFTLLGILKAGCAFLCLDPSAPATRQAFILGDSNAAMLMLVESFDWTSEISLSVHVMSESLLASLPSSRPPLQRQILPSDPCYCLYTSGTTGIPKGCLISHENATQAMAAFKYLFDGRWNSDSRWLQFAAFHFDVSVLEQYWSWYVGITVVAAPKDVILSDLAMIISKLEITHIDLTPSLARLITPDECPTLCKGVFITGGEKLRSDILEVWGSERVIHNAYGPTEATIGITMYRGVPKNGRPSNIGNLFPNVGAYILERGSEIPVLRGGVGELCVSGKLVGIGYLNREALTQERFPMLQASGERVYRTGDLVRVLHDNSLDFIGRADDQVKLRGQRLEIGEINHVIREGLADKASDVATIVTKRRAQDVDLLVSFIAESSNSNTTQEAEVYYDATHIKFAERAHEACRSCLAMYMVPSFIICVSRIPLSTNNKVDINQLKKIFSELSHEQLQALSISSLPSRRTLNNVERKLLTAIEEVVRVKESDLTPTTTVFQLGIDSITASRLARKLRGMDFPSATPSMILRHPQISQLSQALNRSRGRTPSSNSLQFNQSIKALRHRYLSLACKSLEVEKSEVEYIAPCTPLQQGIIARSRVREAQSAYFNQFQLRLNPSVSICRLKAAFNRIIVSCSILRTGFIDTSDGVLQVAIKNRPLRWFEVEAAIETFNETLSARKSLWIESNHEVLKWPVEVDHIRTNGQNHLFLRLFHGVYDARSLSVILESLKDEYEGTSRVPGPAFISVLPDGPLRSHQESHQFWKSLLKYHRFQPMPSLTKTPTTISGVVNKCIKFDGLEDARKKLQVTHQTLLQAAWLYTLRPYFVDPPTIGVILSGRSLAINGIDLVVGPLLNTLPFRVDFTSETSWTLLARKIQEHNNGLLAFVHTPLRDIQKLCANGQPLFDTLFTFDSDYNTIAEDKRAPWSMDDSPGHPDYPLAIELIMVADDMLRVTLAAQGSIADEQSLSTLLDRFTESLDSIIKTDSDVALSFNTQETLSELNEDYSVPSPEPVISTDSHMDTPRNSFEWNSEAHKIRRELALLVEVDEKEISEKTNIFALGLDSIDIIKLAGRLTKLGYNVSIGALMKQPTLDSIVTSLVKPQPTTISSSTISAEGNIVSILENCYRRTGRELSDVEAILPPTPLQDSMVAAMLHSRFHTYFNHDILELPENTEIERLKTAISTVYTNSPILRTVFVEVDDPRINTAYYQVVRKHELKFTPVSQVSNVDDTRKLTDIARVHAEENNGTSGLFQVRFAEMGTRKLMILSIAHALYDGSSLGMLHEDIQAAYENNYTPRQPYTDYLLHMVSQPKASSDAFWADLLHGAIATLVPEVNAKLGGGIFHRIEKQSKMSAADIRALCKVLHATPQVVSQACWAAVLASLTKSLDVVFGVVLSGRDTEEAQGLMFPTMNTVPLRLALHGTVIEFVGYCQDIMSGVIEFQHTPLRDIQKLSPSHSGQLFNTIFLLKNSGDRDASGKYFFRSARSVSAVEYPLCAELEITGENAIWRIACDENHMDSQGVENLSLSLERALEYFARDFNKRVLEISSHDTQTVSICGLAPVTLQTDVEGQQSDVTKERHPSQQTDSQLHGYDTMLEVLSDLCKVDRQAIDLNLSIFHIGLDSISAIKASSMLRKRGLDISTRDLVTTPSIRGILEEENQPPTGILEKSVEEPLSLNSIISAEQIHPLLEQYGVEEDAIEAILPALPMQVHMLSVWQNSHGATFFPKFTFRITGPIDVLALYRAWVRLVNETAMLRTHLVRTASPSLPFLQVILKPNLTGKHVTDALTTSGNEGFVYAATPFAVAQLLAAGSGGAVLNLYLHHGLYDGVSLPIILDRFARFCSDVDAVGPRVHTTLWYKFVLEHHASRIRLQRKSFWTTYLRGSTAVQMYMAQRVSTDTESQRVSEFRRTAINSCGLGLQSSTYGVSTQAFMFAAYAKAFAQRRRQDQHIDDDVDCVFGIYLANRSIYPGLEDVPLPTLNILPLRVKTPMSRTTAAIATDIQKDITGISRFENSTASLWEIHDWTGVRVDTFVNILSRPDDTLRTSNPVSIEEITNKESSPDGSVDMSMHCITPDHESISSNVVRHEYPEAVDIEVAIRGDELDLGIFGASSILSESQARDMVAAILAEIEAF